MLGINICYPTISNHRYYSGCNYTNIYKSERFSSFSLSQVFEDIIDNGYEFIYYANVNSRMVDVNSDSNIKLVRL